MIQVRKVSNRSNYGLERLQYDLARMKNQCSRFLQKKGIDVTDEIVRKLRAWDVRGMYAC